MKRVLLIAIMILATVFTYGQSEDIDALYIYRNDGKFNAFRKSEVDSLVFSKINLDGIEEKNFVIQEIWTKDSVFRIPLSAIDSIGLHRPPVIYRKNVRVDDLKLFQFLKEATDSVLIFDGTMPEDIVPKKGEILALHTDVINNLPEGFVGKVLSITYDINSNVNVSYEGINGLRDIFEQYINIESLVPEQVNNLTRADELPRTNNWLTARFEKEFKWPSISETDDNKKFSLHCNLTGELSGAIESYIYGDEEIHNLRFWHGWEIDLGCNLTIKKESESIENYFKDLFTLWKTPIAGGLFFFNVDIGGGVKTKGKFVSEFNLSIPKLTGKHNFTFGKKFEESDNRETGLRFEGNPTENFFSWGELKFLIEGEAKLGTVIDLNITPIGPKKILKLSAVKCFLGPLIKGHIEFGNDADESYCSYNILKDQYLESCVDVESSIIASIKDKEFQIGKGFKFRINERKFYLLPDFDTPKLNPLTTGNTVEINYPVSRQTIIPVKLGMDLYDYDKNIVDRYTENREYHLNRETYWLENRFSNLIPNERYTVYPTVDIGIFHIRGVPDAEITGPVTVITRDVNKINPYSVKLIGEVPGLEKIRKTVSTGFVYGKAKDFKIENGTYVISDNTTQNVITAVISGLKPMTQYAYVAYISVEGKTTFGEIEYFTTNDTPTINLSNAENITYSSADIKVTFSNLFEGCKCFISYEDAEEGSRQVVEADYTENNQLITLDGLKENTEYLYTAYVEYNGDRIALSSLHSFRTKKKDGSDPDETKPEDEELPDLSGIWTFSQQALEQQVVTLELKMVSGGKKSATYSASGFFGLITFSMTVTLGRDANISLLSPYGYNYYFSGTFDKGFNIVSGDKYSYTWPNMQTAPMVFDGSWSLSR